LGGGGLSEGGGPLSEKEGGECQEKTEKKGMLITEEDLFVGNRRKPFDLSRGGVVSGRSQKAVEGKKFFGKQKNNFLGGLEKKKGADKNGGKRNSYLESWRQAGGGCFLRRLKNQT